MDMRFIVEVSVLETGGLNLKGIEEANWPTGEDRPNAA